MLPQSQIMGLKRHLEEVRRLHRADLAAGWGRVELPGAMARKYPNAELEWAWQWVFPQARRWRGPKRAGKEGTIWIPPWCSGR